MSAPRVKICGIRDEPTVECAASAGADFIGVVLVPSSPRFVAPEEARRLSMAIVDHGAVPVAVVRLPIEPEAHAALEAFPIVQFHGDEPVEAVAAFRGWERWKGLRFSPAASMEWLASSSVERLVVDGPEAGSGAAWDLAEFARLDGTLRARCLLAGGLDAGNVAAAVRAARPWGVDVSSGVESTRGVKDHARIRAFIEAARGA